VRSWQESYRKPQIEFVAKSLILRLPHVLTNDNMSDLYDKIKEDVAFRRKWAERCAFGFDLPSVVPNVPKTAEKAEAEEAA
jgi:hypothetical protein